MTQSNRLQQQLADQLLKQDQAYRDQPYASAAVRQKRLRALKKMLVENRAEICDAIDEDFAGRSKNETLIAEYLPSVMAINDAVRHLKGWMKPDYKMPHWLFQPATAKVLAQPLGIVGIMVPWNYPLYLAIGPLVGALSAGNHAMVKLSEFTPKFAALFERLIRTYFTPGLITVVNGETEVAQAFSALPFDHLVFTGSTAVGKHVMRAASDNLTPVTLELGGKSPAVIDRSIGMAEAAQRLVFAKSMNAGQTCVAPDYVLCPEESIDDFIQHYIAETKRQYADIRDNDDFSSIINERQRQRLIHLLNDAKAQGATLYIVDQSGNLEDSDAFENDISFEGYGTKFPPVLVKDAPAGCELMTEEIFGPILPVVGYNERAEALQYINARPRPLALYVFGFDRALKPLFEQGTHSGALLFNEALIHVAMENLPFGGVGASGIGQYHGFYGFQRLSKLKPIVSKGRISSLKWLYPPYKGWIIQLMLKIMRG